MNPKEATATVRTELADGKARIVKIGFIGLGIIGSRMAANLLKHGHSLVVFNRTREKAEPLIAAGAQWAEFPAALVENVQIVFTMFAHPDGVEEAELGSVGFLSYLSRE